MRASRVAERGASSAFKGPQPTMMMATIGRWVAPAFGTSRPPHAATSVRCGRLQTTYKRLLEEACPNHAYPIRHKLKDCNMMWSFMISGSVT
jgi:hypothetical protein